MPKFKNIFITALINILFINACYCQYSENLISIHKKINSGQHKNVSVLLEEINVDQYKLTDKAYIYYLKALNEEYKNREDSAYKYYLKAKELYLLSDSTSMAMDINLDIAYLISSQKKNFSDYSTYTAEYIKYAQKSNDSSKLAKAYLTLGTIEMDTEKLSESRQNLLKALAFYKRKNITESISIIYKNLATIYSEKLNEPDSALYYLKKDSQIIKNSGDQRGLCYNLVNQAAAYYYKGNYKTAISLLKSADSLVTDDYNLRTKQIIYEVMSVNYEAVKDYKNAYNYLTVSNQLNDSINATEQNIAINDIQTKYQAKEKELENEVLKGDIKTNRIILYSSLLVLAISFIIGFLIIKNSRKREKISRQEKLIEQQKLDKALKDYELHSIDMMLEGQEKERQRIANDLHDNLGSMLAALKLNFENLRLRRNEVRDEEDKLYDRTDNLIEEAYQKVRSLAHAKNAGVFANEGLIPALKKLAEKISIPGRLAITVTSFGFNKRLENKLEITIFRIIQELATNIIKHSKASEASVQLTHHDDNINIIIEDNGIGIKKSEQNKADGMGLQTIIKKTEQLGGTFNIDSTPGKGTTIIIDIPI